MFIREDEKSKFKQNRHKKVVLLLIRNDRRFEKKLKSFRRCVALEKFLIEKIPRVTNYVFKWILSENCEKYDDQSIWK